MKLVNIHKQAILLLVLILGVQKAQAQVWSLQQCMDTALVHNRNLQMSRNTMAIGDQKMKEAKANLIPKAMVNADYKYFANLPYQFLPLSTFNAAAPEGQFKEAQFGVPHNINANVQLSMPLYNPQVYGAIQATKIAKELSELQYEKTADQIYYEISNLYYNAQILHYQLEFIDSNIMNATKLVSNMQLLHEQLLAKGIDVSKIKLQIAQLNTQKEIISSKYEQIVNALKFAIGMPIEKNIQIDLHIQYKNENENKNASIVELQIAKTQIKLISNELKTMNKSRFLPTLNLVGLYGTTGFGYDKRPNDFLKFYPISFAGAQLSYPLFNGTVTLRKIYQKKLELKNNELQYSLLTEQNNMQTENAKLQRIVTMKSVETTIEQIDLAKTIYEQTILQQKYGTANLTDVLLADNALRESQQAYIAAVVDYLKADLELKKLTGNISIKN